jgi:WD40 repeat protein
MRANILSLLLLALFSMPLFVDAQEIPHINLPDLIPITADNADQLEAIGRYGTGGIGRPYWISEERIAVSSDLGVWIHDANMLDQPPRLIAEYQGGTPIFSADGSKMLMWSRDTTITMWNVESGEQIDLPTSADEIAAIAPDFSRAALVRYYSMPSWDYRSHATIEFWDLQTPELIGTRELRRLQTSTSRDGSRLHAYSSAGGYNEVIEIRTGETIFSVTDALEGSIGSFGASALSSDGQVLAVVTYTQGSNGLVQLWDVDTGTLLYDDAPSLETHQHPIYSMQFSPDDLLLFISTESTITAWDITTGEQRYTLPLGIVTFSPDGSTIVLQTQDETALYDTSTGERRQTDARLDQAEAFGFRPDSQYLVTCLDGRVQIWNAETFDLVSETVERFYFTPGDLMGMSQDGRRLVTRSDVVHFLNTDTFEMSRVLDQQVSVWNSWLSPDASLLVTGATVWNLQNGTNFHLAPANRPHEVAFSPDSQWIAMASGLEPGCPDSTEPCHTSSAVEIFSVDTGEKVLTVDEVFSTEARFTLFYNVIFSPDGRFLATSNSRYGIRLYDWPALLAGENTQPIAYINQEYGAGDVISLSFSADSTLLAAGYGFICLSSCDGLSVLPGPYIGHIWSVQQAVTGYELDESNAIISLRTFTETRESRIRFTQDNHLLMVDIGRIASPAVPLLWNTRSGEIQFAFSPGSRLIFSLDMRILYTSRAGTVRLWGIPADE